MSEEIWLHDENARREWRRIEREMREILDDQLKRAWFRERFWSDPPPHVKGESE